MAKSYIERILDRIPGVTKPDNPVFATQADVDAYRERMAERLRTRCHPDRPKSNRQLEKEIEKLKEEVEGLKKKLESWEADE